MATGPAFRDIAEEERDAERVWEERHAGLNSSACYALAIDELRKKHEAGEQILSAEYAPRSSIDNIDTAGLEAA